MKRRHTLALGAGLALPVLAEADAGAGAGASAAAGQRVLRVVFPVAETGFDPVRLSDVYSVTVTAHIFDAAYQFDHLARPVKLRPRVAAKPHTASPRHTACIDGASRMAKGGFILLAGRLGWQQHLAGRSGAGRARAGGACVQCLWRH